MSTSFQPMPTKSASISVTTTSANAAIDSSAPQIRLYNAGSATAFVRWGSGTQTALTTDMALAAGAIETFTKNTADNIAAITSSGTATLYITPGVGD